MEPNAAPYPPPPLYGCYRHPERPTGVGCQRCGRPICGECMRPAPVGVQCPDCVAAAQAQVRPQLARAQRARAVRSFSDAAATFTLIAINVVVWLAVFVTGGEASPLLDTLMLKPTASCAVGGGNYINVSAARCAAEQGTWFPGVSDGAWWQLLTSAFTHASPMHIGFNMLALWFLGPQLERFLGRPRFVALYLLSAVAGSVVVYWLADPRTSTLGASGAIFGLMGALLVIAWRHRGDVRNILTWLGINVAFTFLGGPGISWEGHLGGLAGGLAITWVLLSRRGRQERSAWVLLGVFGLVLVALTAARTLTMG